MTRGGVARFGGVRGSGLYVACALQELTFSYLLFLFAIPTVKKIVDFSWRKIIP